MLNARRVNPPNKKPTAFFIMPEITFNFGDTSKTVELKDINSINDVASSMKEVIKESYEKKDSPHKKNTTNG